MSADEITTLSEMERSYAADRPARDGYIVRADPPVPHVRLLSYEAVKECPQCGGVCHRKNVAVEDFRAKGFCITLTFCDHCDMGSEILWDMHPTGWQVDSRAEHRGAKLLIFRKRLEALQCVAA